MTDIVALSTEMIFSNMGLTAYIIIIAFFTGTVFGSFINCLAWRIVHGESFIKGRSHCAVCSHVLEPADLIPVWSYIFLRGRCRYCHEKISPRYMITELIMGCTFLIIVLRFGIGIGMLRYMVLSCILMALSLVDLDSFTIPDGTIIAAIISWIITELFLPGAFTLDISGGIIGGLVGGFAIAGAMLIISLVFDRLTGKESLGGGDIKLFFVAGLYLGGLKGLLCVIVSSVTGLLFVAVMKKQRIPFGPSISIGLLFCALFGDKIVNWYLSLL